MFVQLFQHTCVVFFQNTDAEADQKNEKSFPLQPWRIIPTSKWVITMDHGDRKSPKWGCGTPSKWPKWLINGGYPPWNQQFAPENRPSPKETSIPTIHSQVLTVCFREGITGMILHPEPWRCLWPSTKSHSSQSHHPRQIRPPNAEVFCQAFNGGKYRCCILW